MYDLIRFFENENYTMYTLSVNGQVFASVPKNLKGNIKTFMLFKDSILQEQEKTKIEELIYYPMVLEEFLIFLSLP